LGRLAEDELRGSKLEKGRAGGKGRARELHWKPTDSSTAGEQLSVGVGPMEP
jgi:hypothetical protein